AASVEFRKVHFSGGIGIKEINCGSCSRVNLARPWTVAIFVSQSPKLSKRLHTLTGGAVCILHDATVYRYRVRRPKHNPVFINMLLFLSVLRPDITLAI